MGLDKCGMFGGLCYKQTGVYKPVFVLILLLRERYIVLLN
jgi:hypothetical protein